MISKARAMGESAMRTFLQAALPAFGASLYAAGGNLGKAVLLGALAAAAAAGLAAVARAVKPLQTDAAGVGVAGVTPSAPAHTSEAGYPPPAAGTGPGKSMVGQVYDQTKQPPTR